MVRLKGKAKMHPQVVEFQKALLLKPLDNGSLVLNGLSFQRKDPTFDADYCTPHEPVSMVLPDDDEIHTKKKRKRKRKRKRKSKSKSKMAANTCENVQKKKKRKSAGSTSERSKRIGYNPWMQIKIKTLGLNLFPIPFSPKKFLDLEPHKCLLTNLGLWDFLNLDFARHFVPGLINEIIANYNPKRPIDRVTFYDGNPIEVSQSVLASALRLPTNTKLPDQTHTLQSMVLVVSEEEALFVQDLIWNYMVLQDPDTHFPDEVMNVVSLVKERKLEQVDWADLVWFMMKKELLQGIKLTHCYYASHMQYLVQYHYPDLFDNSDDDNETCLEMESVAHNKGHATENQLMLLVENENNDLNNGLFLENSCIGRMEVAISTMDNAHLNRCTAMEEIPSVEGHSSSKLETLGGQMEACVKIVEEEDHMVNEDEICNVDAEQDLEEGNRYMDFVARLFDEVENGESQGTVNKGFCDANSEYQQKEDDGMDTQTDDFSWHAMDDTNDPHSVETSYQQVGFVITQNKESTESMSDVVVAEDNVLTQVPSIDHNSGEHGGEQISVPAEDATDMEQERTDMMLVCVEKHIEESRQLCDSNASTPLEKKEVSMMAANDADHHSSETTNQQSLLGGEDPISDVLIPENTLSTTEHLCADQHSSDTTNQLSVLGGEDPISDVLIPENTVSSTEHLCVSDISVAMELKDKDMLPKTCQQATDKGDVSELEHSHRPVKKGDEQDVQKGADFGAHIQCDGRNQGVSEAQGVNAAIVLESDSEEETEQQLNLIHGYGDMDVETPQFYDGNACNMQSSKIDACAQEVDFWISNFKLVPHVQPHPSNEEIIQDLNAKLAQQIQENETYKIQLHQQIEVNENYRIQLQDQHQMMHREITRYATELSLADELAKDYRSVSKAREKCFSEHLKKCQQTVEEVQYMDHPEENGKMITVAAWEKLKQEHRDQEICNLIQSMFYDFEAGLTVELGKYFGKLDTLFDRVSVCGDSINMLKENVSRS